MSFLNTQRILDNIASYGQQALAGSQRDGSAAPMLKMGVVTAVPSTLTVNVRFYGEDSASTKTFKCLGSYSSPAVDDVVILVRTGSTWLVVGTLNEEASGTPTTLSGLSDTTISGATDNEVLAYDSGTDKWINQTAAEAGLATAGHNHDADYAAIGHNHDSDYSALGHTHDDRYYTETEVDTLLTGYATTSHNHDSDYVNVSGDTMTGTLNTRALLPSADNSYALGATGYRYSAGYAAQWVAGSMPGNTAPTWADDFVVDHNSNSGITIFSGTGSTGTVNFGDSDDYDQGRISYGHATDTLAFYTASSVRLSITGAVGTASMDLVPATDSTYDLGSSGVRWALAYIDDLTVTTSVTAGVSVTTGTLTANNTATFKSTVAVENTTYTGGGGSAAALSQDTTGFLRLTNATSFRPYMDVLPGADATYDLGSVSLAWAQGHIDTVYTNEVYGPAAGLDITGAGDINLIPNGLSANQWVIDASGAHTIDGTTLTIGAQVTPKTDLAYDLGGSSFRWSTAYIYNIVSAGTTYLNDVDLSGDLIPSTDSASNLGSSSKYWSTVYADNFQVSSGGHLKSAGSYIVVDADLIPNSDNTDPLGYSTNRWSTLYANVGYLGNPNAGNSHVYLAGGTVQAYGARTSSYGPNLVMRHGDIANDPYMSWSFRGASDATYVDQMRLEHYDGTSYYTVVSFGSPALGDASTLFSDFEPGTDSTYSLGSTSKYWLAAYIDTTATPLVFSPGDLTLKAYTSSDIFLQPGNASTYQLTLSDNGYHVLQGNQFATQCNITPYSDSAYNLGTSSARWSYVHADHVQIDDGGLIHATTNAGSNFYKPYYSGTDAFGAGNGGYLGTVSNLGILIDTNNNGTTDKFWVGANSTSATSATPVFYVQEDGTVGIYGDAIPQTDSTYDLGSTSKYWANVYSDTFISGGTDIGRGLLDLQRDTSSTTTGVTTTETTVSGSTSSSVTLVSGRRYRIDWQVLARSTVAEDIFVIRLYKTIGGSPTVVRQHNLRAAGANQYNTYGFTDYYDCASSSAHTFHLTIQRISGSGTLDVLTGTDYPIELVVSDVGTT